jgi:hypothetical protein
MGRRVGLCGNGMGFSAAPQSLPSLANDTPRTMPFEKSRVPACIFHKKAVTEWLTSA